MVLSSLATRHLRPGLVALSAFVGLSACSEVVPVSGPHAPLDAHTVKIYQRAPRKYEMLGTVEVPVTAEMKWDERGDSTAGFMALKEKAGQSGATGILLKVDHARYDTEVGAGFNGQYYLVPLRLEPRTAMAAAIFVVEE